MSYDMMQDIDEVLFTRGEILQKVDELAERINRDYAGKELTMVCILKGSVMFYAELLLRVKLPVLMDFMSISSYGQSSKSSGVVRILKDLDNGVENRHVLIVEDIVDTGLTLKYIIESMENRNPASVKVCALLDKPSRRKADVAPDYLGFSIPDAFAVGYGLDYSEQYRNLPDICSLKPAIYMEELG